MSIKSIGMSNIYRSIIVSIIGSFLLLGCGGGSNSSNIQDDSTTDPNTSAVSSGDFDFPNHLRKTGCVYTTKEIDRDGNGISEKTYTYDYNDDGYILIEEQLNDELNIVSRIIHTYISNRIDKIEYFSVSNGVAEITRTINYQYYKDEDGLYTKVELGERSWTSTHYNNDGQKIKHYYYNAGDNYFNLYVRYEYDNSGYEIQATEYENGDSYDPTNITYNTYDANTGGYETSFDYQANGELVSQLDIVEGLNESLGEQERSSTSTTFDDGSEQTLSTVTTTKDDGTSETKYISTLKKYDNEGNLIAREKDYGNNGESIQITKYSNYECFN